ncbi:SDR family oxidoreductase [Aureivirga sp. CE67]|uniref:SDR family oxidoreductase n=1 Tax=Aureivirga sp. CE67 TaxID=1788983 RepID=UPI0018C93CBE|nr:SDR family oxidoreductase [Aureivirga sp. CE67]
MKVVVAGSRGAIGKMLVNKLIQSGYDVTAIVRKKEQLEDLKNENIHGILADVSDLNSLLNATKNADIVYFTAGSKGKNLIGVDQNGAINLAKAAIENKVQRFVLLSSIYAGRPDEGPDELRDYFHAKNIADRFVESSELNYTIVRPGFLYNENAKNKIKTGEAFSGKESKITREDVATILLNVIKHENTIRKTFEVIEGKQPIKETLSEL